MEENSLSPNPTAAEVFILRLRGLPWTVSVSDVCDFFSGIEVVSNSVVICLSDQGRPTGTPEVRQVFWQPQNSRFLMCSLRRSICPILVA